MGSNFGEPMNRYFDTVQGAFSVVTNDEFNKSQITFVGPEQEIAENFFGNAIANNHGNIETIKNSGFDPEVEFRKFPDGERIRLTVSYKTGRPNELRLYMRKGLFKPLPGQYWGLFVKDNTIWICHFSAWMKREIESGRLLPKGRSQILEPDDDDFQSLVNGAPPGQVKSVATKWKRDPLIAAKAIATRNFCCELYPCFPSFISRSSNQRFVEAHHLVPMREQAQFGANLDSQDNICVLSPFAHRKIHHASFDDIVLDLKRLIDARAQLLERLSLVPDDVLGLYR